MNSGVDLLTAGGIEERPAVPRGGFAGTGGAAAPGEVESVVVEGGVPSGVEVERVGTGMGVGVVAEGGVACGAETGGAGVAGGALLGFVGVGGGALLGGVERGGPPEEGEGEGEGAGEGEGEGEGEGAFAGGVSPLAGMGRDLLLVSS